jgi:hypothetical protein
MQAPPGARVLVSNAPQEVGGEFIVAVLREAGNVIDLQ